MISCPPPSVASRLLWRRCSRWAFRGAAAASVAWSSACSDGTGPSPPYPLTQVSPDWVTPEVARLVGPEGRFGEISATPDLPDEIGKDGVIAIMAALNRATRTGTPTSLSFVEQDHGAPINFTRLVPCARALYMQSSFEPLESDRDTPSARMVTELLRGSLNGVWVVPWCDPSGEFVMVHTLTSRTRFFVRTDGTISFDSLGSTGGGGWTSSGIPKGSRPPFRSPERAVEMVFGVTGTRVATAPQAVMNRLPLAGFLSGFLWRMKTDTPVRGRILPSNKPMETREFYTTVSFAHQDGAQLDTTRVYVAAPEVPGPRWEKHEVRLPPDHQISVLDSVLIVPRWALRLYEFVPDR